jgi:uncharacterized protein (TIGR02266 family)
MSAEQHRYRRISTNWIVRIRSRTPLESTRLRLDERIRNVSLGGVFIETRYPFPVGAMVEFEFQLPGHAATYQAKGIVRWANDGTIPDQAIGMGIEFIEVAQKTREVIEHAVQSPAAASPPAACSRIAPLIASHDHQKILRFHRTVEGRTLSLEDVASRSGVAADHLLGVLSDFAVQGLAVFEGNRVRFQPIPDAELRRAVDEWLAAHPA